MSILNYLQESFVTENDDYDINTIERRNGFNYPNVSGVYYQVKRGEEVEEAYTSDIRSTEENEFYPEHIEKYKDYIRDGGVIETFPVQVTTLSRSNRLSHIVEHFEEHDDDTTLEMYGLLEAWDDLNDYEFFEKLGFDEDTSSDLAQSRPDSSTDFKDFMEYYDDFPEVKDHPKMKEIFEGAKEIFEWAEVYNEEYHLVDMNHRFQAVKSLGANTILIDRV